MEKVILLTKPRLGDLPLLPQGAWVRGPGVGTAPRGASLQAVFSFGVTSFLLLFLPPLPGRTGLLADLLPSFAVEIMPGIHSFNSLFA